MSSGPLMTATEVRQRVLESRAPLNLMLDDLVANYAWHLRMHPGFRNDGRPLSLFARARTWLWLRRCEHRIRRQLRETKQLDPGDEPG